MARNNKQNKVEKKAKAFEMVDYVDGNGKLWKLPRLKEKYIGKLKEEEIPPWLPPMDVLEKLKGYKDQGFKGVKYYKNETIIAMIDLTNWIFFGRVKGDPNGRPFYWDLLLKPYNNYRGGAYGYLEKSINNSDKKELLKESPRLSLRKKEHLDINKV